MTFKVSLILILGYFILISNAFYAPDAVNLTNLPQIGTLAAQNNYTANWYSGYLYLNSNKQLHYMFLESQSQLQTDPLVLWLNGGPGCSSLIGAVYEHGPFVFPDGNSEFVWNPYSWNTNAHVIYLESPACVGFSYIGDNSTLFNDTNTAQDNLQALLQWFIKFPEFKNNAFFIAGESYGGIYVPTLAVQIIEYNEQNPNNQINLQGIAVGNGVTDWEYDTTPADWDFYWNHGLYSPSLRQKYLTYCLSDPESEECAETLTTIQNDVEQINNYDIYKPCYGLNSTIPDDAVASSGLTKEEYISNVVGVNYARFREMISTTVGGTEIDAPGAAPCIDSVGAYAWLNTPAVRTGLNIFANITYNWMMCSNQCNYSSGTQGSYWAYPIILNAGIRAMFYSGDADGSVPTLGSMKWIQNLATQYSLPIINPMSQWTIPGNWTFDPQVAGFVTDYQGFRFVTAKGVGHMVPQWQRAGAYKMIYAFLNNVDLTQRLKTKAKDQKQAQNNRQ